MHKHWRLLVILTILHIMGNIIHAQVAIPGKDILVIKEKKENKDEPPRQVNENEPNKKSFSNDDYNQSLNGDKKTGVKQVRSTRPDMSKAKGARPPQIMRPSGSGVPKGIGKPGGAKGPGRR